MTTPITTTEDLARICKAALDQPYVTIDTEFLRERTYYPRLCLIQLALPPAAKGKDRGGQAVLIDPLADGISLEPLYELFRHKNTVKVFHAARQDLEIFFHAARTFPEPLFDTQVAAMVCGFGEQVSYETLVKRIARQRIDKSSRFTDWSQRPLSAAQQDYALADVTHLRQVYEYLRDRLEESGRAPWVAEEMAALTTPETYIIQPSEAWRRVRTRSTAPRFLAALKELAEFREAYAQSHDVPRSRVFKDDALTELASTRPMKPGDLGKSRLLLREARRGDIAEGIIAAVKRAAEQKAPAPANDHHPGLPGNPALSDLLRVLLKARADSSGVAARLIAHASDLDALASGERDLAALRGWRAEVFGNDALRLCAGEVALAARDGQIETVPLSA